MLPSLNERIAQFRIDHPEHADAVSKTGDAQTEWKTRAARDQWFTWLARKGFVQQWEADAMRETVNKHAPLPVTAA
jgi:hypothetical protein